MYNIKDIAKGGEYLNKDFWIAELCTSTKKPRVIVPRLARLLSTDDIKQQVYYSNTFFRDYGENNKLKSSSIIKLYDNTGYRAYPGNPISVFDTKEEAEKWFLEKISTYIQTLKEELESAIVHKTNEIQKYQGIKNLITGMTL